jgi:biotin-(acetyl-CoA carboxylase) ligase
VAFLQRLACLIGHLGHAPDHVGRIGNPSHISQLANGLCLQRGKTLTVKMAEKTIRGECRGIAPDGALLLHTPEGESRVVSGTVLPGGRIDLQTRPE